MDQDLKDRLERAVPLVNGSAHNIDHALRVVLRDVRDHARWLYAYNELSRKLRQKIAAAAKRPGREKKQPVLQGARAHELFMLLGLPPNDR